MLRAPDLSCIKRVCRQDLVTTLHFTCLSALCAFEAKVTLISSPPLCLCQSKTSRNCLRAAPFVRVQSCLPLFMIESNTSRPRAGLFDVRHSILAHVLDLVCVCVCISTLLHSWLFVVRLLIHHVYYILRFLCFVASLSLCFILHSLPILCYRSSLLQHSHHLA